MMMKGRDQSKGPPSTDLLVCFPTRSHLTLMPKAICSPARSSESSRRHPHPHHRHNHSLQHHHLRKSIKRRGTIGQASPLSWAKTKASSTSENDEPTSPKVTCAGQIKVRQKPSSCKNWQSVMEEIEKIHNNKKQKKKKTPWVETIVFKKEVMQFLTCLRSIKLDFRCFGSFPSSDITSDDDDDDDDEDEEDEEEEEGNVHHDHNQESRTVFSKWFMVLQENQNKDEINEGVVHDQPPCAPPPNALLLMRCRSAPAKSWLEEKEEEEDDENEDDDEEEEEENEEEKEEEEKRKKENLVVMNYNTDFSRFSTDIVKETWVVGGIKDSLSRSRSWKR